MASQGADSISRYEAHLEAGGAPFGGEFNATIREAVEGYMEVIRRLRADVERLQDGLDMAQGEAYLGTLAGDDVPDPLAACHNVITACLDARKAEHA